MRFREMDLTNYNKLKTIYEEEYNLFLNLKNPVGTSITTHDSGKTISFI